MDDMYGNGNGTDNGYNGYNGMNGDSAGGNDPYQQSYQQSTVHDQLQYQYGEPKNEMEEPITMGEWLISLLIMIIPCVNIVMMFVWAFSSNVKKSKSNYFKAALIMYGIMLVLSIIATIVLSASVASSLYYY